MSGEHVRGWIFRPSVLSRISQTTLVRSDTNSRHCRPTIVAMLSIASDTGTTTIHCNSTRSSREDQRRSHRMTATNRREFLQHALDTATMGSAIATLGVAAARSEEKPAKLRLGVIGLDTSHVTVFAKAFNREHIDDPKLNNIRITAAFPAGNPDFPLSRDRLEGFTKEVRELGVEIVPSLADLLPLVDGVLLESVDGTQHLEQAGPVFEAGKPLVIDKPLAASLKDVLAIAGLGRKHQVPWFTASSSRFTPGYPELRQNAQVGDILGCDTYSQSRAAIGHPDLFWYGVHGVDLLYSLMSTGCQTVTAIQTQFFEQVSGTWNNGRVGTYRAIREHTAKTG